MKYILPFLLLAIPAGALELSPEQRNAFGAELRSYLLEHPEVVREALRQAETHRYTREAQNDLARLNENAGALFDSPQDWAEGRGDVTLVAFVDYACASCADMPAVARAMATRDTALRIVMKDYAPGPETGAARLAQAILHVDGPDAYLKAQRALFALPDHTPTTLRALAHRISTAPQAVLTHMEAPETHATIARTARLARTLDLGPAPVWVLPDALVRGDVPPIALTRAIDRTRSR
ncbi:thioredoxin-like protein [Rhodovulum imhoffii]|uniref:Thioredoxin-like protein n=1 Tax=Rhodovulum imhoffii TaxID=365340 RepID=A0A2T5BVS1_9RHOB|nr:thioredoxin domain-containing protein [Rhodovulum imhoffii]MBK5933220.1 hypothetical protein [Rhodovulum imhoffii]PTN03679.1 thioredoxin-like protein [Rhodovulum imhoffii]